MSILSRVFGWEPPGNAEYIEVVLPIQATTCHSPTNPGNSNQITSATGLNIQSTSSTSTISPFSILESNQQDICASLDLLTDTGDREATWVSAARPCDKFTLFCSDYVRGKRVRHGLGSDTEKSLSKQAAKAWQHLPQEERLYWKERASNERLDHARRHPDYRHQPKKSSMAMRRQARSPTMNSEATSSSSGKTIAKRINPHLHSPSINGSPPEHVLINPTPRRSSDVAYFAVGDSSHQHLRSLDSLDWSSTISETSSSSNIQCIESPYSQYTRASVPLPLRLQIPVSSPSLDAPDSRSPSSYLTNFSPSSTSPSLSDWNGENMVYPCGSGSSDVSRSDLSQISLSNFNLGLELADAPVDSNTNTDSSFMHEYTIEEMPFIPPPSSLSHHQEQQQELFDNGLYQPTGNLWMSSSYSIDSDAQMDMVSQADFNAARAHAQHSIRGRARAATLATSTPSILKNDFYEATFAGGGGTIKLPS